MGKKTQPSPFILFFIFIALLFISVVLHELSHAVAAIIFGVNPAELKFGWYILGPGVTVPDTFPLEDLVHFRYAGGAGAGILLLIGYITYILKCRAAIKAQGLLSTNWWVGGIILFWSIFQFYNGYIESMRFDDYVTGSINYIIPFILLLLLTSAIHFSIYYIITKRNRSFRIREAND